MYSFGKAWQMQGQRTGYLAVSPRFTPAALAPRRLEQGMRLSGHCTPTSIMQHLAADLADAPVDNTELADLQHHARTALRAHGLDIPDAGATRFLYARCPTGTDDLSFVTTLATQGILTMPSTVFHEPGFFRLALNVPRADLTRALDTIGKAAAGA